MNVLNLHSPAPLRPCLKRKLEALDAEVEPLWKRHRSQLPVLDWLGNISSPQRSIPPAPTRSQSVIADFNSNTIIYTPCQRSQSIPAKFDDQLPLILKYLEHPKFPVQTDEMGDRCHSLRRESWRGDDYISQNSKSTENTKETRSSRIPVKSFDAIYRDVLHYNRIHVDPTGLDMSEDVRVFVRDNIQDKKRTSPALEQDELNKVARGMAKLANSPEAVVTNLTKTPLFPIEKPGLATGGNTRFPGTALPYNAIYGQRLSAPKPDFTVGYPVGAEAPWSDEQAAVIDHPHARDYTRPATGNSLPFFVLELKSEATGGTLWHAESQAAGSGTYCVKAMQWLVERAERGTPTALDTIAFSVITNQRHAVFYVHYYDKEIEKYVMSYIQSCTIVDPKDIQACRNIVKNIQDFGLQVRFQTLRKCLGQVYDKIDSWSNKRAASAADSTELPTSATSVTKIQSAGNRKP